MALYFGHRAWRRLVGGDRGSPERMAGLALAIYASVFVAPVFHYQIVLLGIAVAFKLGFAPTCVR